METSKERPLSADSGRERVMRIVKQHVCLAACLAAYVCILRRCPILWLTGVPCPGCGMTRACGALLHLDIAGAFYYHPLFWLVPPAALYLAHQSAWHLPGGPRARRVVLVGVIVSFVGVYLYRLFCMPDSPIAVEWERSALYRLWQFLCARFG